ncbi:hypothetical protein D918_06971 [Trichuris suis]|nr:hypothetical protein D918_06971 [Trichuris suis]
MYVNGTFINSACWQLRRNNDVATEQCRLTHSHPDAVMGCIVVTAAIVHVLQCEHELTEKECIDAVAKVVMQEHTNLYPYLRSEYLACLVLYVGADK